MNQEQQAIQNAVQQANAQQGQAQTFAVLRLTLAAQLSAPLLAIEYARARANTKAEGDEFDVGHLQGDGEAKPVELKVEMTPLSIGLQATDILLKNCGFKFNQTPGAK